MIRRDHFILDSFILTGSSLVIALQGQVLSLSLQGRVISVSFVVLWFVLMTFDVAYY